jgi:hypothetical protein
MATFNDLLSRHVGSAFARQLAFGDLLGERNWSLTVSEGIATFGSDLRFPVQLLGTEADCDGTWLWAWANKASNLPEKVLEACNKLRELGEREGIPELRERTFSLEQANGHSLSSVASGIIGRCCYYRGPYDGGALYFLVCGPPEAVLQKVPAERAVTVIAEVISNFDVDHRAMVESFLQAQGFSVTANAGEVVATRGSDQITLTFDSQDRLTNIGGKLAGKPQPQPRPWWQFWKK